MAGTLVDAGAQYILEVIGSNTTTKETEWTVHLFTNNATISDGTIEGDLTEASGGGYSSQTVDADASYIESVAITSSSAANPTNILATSHGLTTGDYISIENHSGASTNLNGTHQVTVVDTDNFTIPVDLSSGTGGTGGTLSRGLESSSVGGIRQLATQPIPFVFTGALDGSATVYGYYIKAGSTLLAVEKLGTTHTPTTDGDKIKVDLTIKMSKGTTT